MMFVIITFVLSVIGGMLLLIVGGVTAANYPYYGFPPLIGVGMGLFICGFFIFIFGLVTIQFRRAARMRQAIAEESMKYSSRSLTPCSWRLETTGHYYGGYGNNNAQVLNHVSVSYLIKILILEFQENKHILIDSFLLFLLDSD
jgi:hypothetical protein